MLNIQYKLSLCFIGVCGLLTISLQLYEEVRKSLEQCDIQEDLGHFINLRRTGDKPPGDTDTHYTDCPVAISFTVTIVTISSLIGPQFPYRMRISTAIRERCQTDSRRPSAGTSVSLPVIIFNYNPNGS